MEATLPVRHGTNPSIPIADEKIVGAGSSAYDILPAQKPAECYDGDTPSDSAGAEGCYDEVGMKPGPVGLPDGPGGMANDRMAMQIFPVLVGAQAHASFSRTGRQSCGSLCNRFGKLGGADPRTGDHI
jgi:hypothetical protein